MTDDKILIFRNQGIGDLILISPAIRVIRNLHPDAHISIFVGDWSRVSVEGNPHIDEIISYPDSWIQDKKPLRILQLVNILRQKRFDRVYIFHSHNKLHLIVRLAGIPERYGFSFRGTGRFLTHKTEWEPNTSRYIADNYLDIPGLAGYEGTDTTLDFHLSPEDEESAEKVIESNNIDRENFIVMAPGGGINPRQDVFEKRWGTDKFAGLIDLLTENKIGGDRIILVGAPAERELCEEIIKSAETGGIINLCGDLSFGASAALVKKSRLLVCNDSSIMHTAVVFGVPSVAIFGPSNPRSLLPVSSINRWISSELDCSPCYCNSIFQGCEKDLACLRELSPPKVLLSIKELWVEQYNATKILSHNPSL